MTHVMKTKEGKKFEVEMWCNYQTPPGSEKRCCGADDCTKCTHGMATMSLEDCYKLLKEVGATRA